MESFPPVKIAVCGHRQLSEAARLETGIQAAVMSLHTAYPGRHYRVLSCLAEGADRLLANRLVHSLPAELTVLLPLPEAEYLKDFPTRESIEEFRNLKNLAIQVIEPAPGRVRPMAYRAANRSLVEACDVLIAIWDGAPARGSGGTGEAVRMARKVGRPLLWIHASDGPGFGNLSAERFSDSQ